jgi:hypothetical protein
MGLSVNFGDKLAAGNHNSITIITRSVERCVTPAAVVKIDGGSILETTIKLIDDDKYKLRFFIPEDAKGKICVSLKVGSEQFEETVAIS